MPRKSAQITDIIPWQINKQVEKNTVETHWHSGFLHGTNNFHMCQNRVADLESHCACIVAKFSTRMQLDRLADNRAIAAHKSTTPCDQVNLCAKWKGRISLFLHKSKD